MALAVYLNKSIFPVSVNTGDFSGKLPTTLSIRAGDSFVGDTSDPLVVSALAAGLVSLVAADPGNFLAGIVPGTADAAALGTVLGKLSVQPAAMTYVSGNSQTDTAGNTLADPFVVLITDAAGSPVAGATVLWSVVGGGGSLSALTSTTDALGQASSTGTLGAVAGANQYIARSYGAAGLLPDPVTFTATGT